MNYHARNFAALAWFCSLAVADFDTASSRPLQVTKQLSLTSRMMREVNIPFHFLVSKSANRKLLTVNSPSDTQSVMPETWTEAKAKLQNCIVNNYQYSSILISFSVMVDGLFRSSGRVAAIQDDTICGVSDEAIKYPDPFLRSDEETHFFRIKCCELPDMETVPITVYFFDSVNENTEIKLNFPSTPLQNSGRIDGKLAWPSDSVIGSITDKDGLPILTGSTKKELQKSPKSLTKNKKKNGNREVLIIILIYTVFTLLAFSTCVLCFFMSKIKLQSRALEMTTLPIVQRAPQVIALPVRNKLF